MKISKEINEHELREELWGQGRENYNELIELGADEEDIYNAALEYMAGGDENEPVDATELNDLFWFDIENLKEFLGLSTEEEEE